MNLATLVAEPKIDCHCHVLDPGRFDYAASKPDPAAGLEQPGFRALLDFGRDGRAVVKLSGYVKFSATPHPYPDARPFVAALVDAFGFGACGWGSDWPFLRAPERIDYGPLLALVGDIFPGATDRRRLFWETPARVFGFDALTE